MTWSDPARTPASMTQDSRNQEQANFAHCVWPTNGVINIHTALGGNKVAQPAPER